MNATALRPVDAIDRAWAGVWYSRSVLRVDMPGFEQLRAALGSLVASASGLARWTTADQLRWQPVTRFELDDWLDETLVSHPAADPTPEAVLRHHPRQLTRTPFRLLAGADWLSIRANHVFGDGWSSDHLFGELLRRARILAEGGILADDPPWQVLSGRQRDRLIRGQVRRHLRTVAWALRHRDELAGGVYEPAGPDVAPGRDALLEISSGPGFPKVLRRLRDELFPGISAAAVGMVGLRAAIAAVLPEPRPGFECLYNTRSAEAGTATAFGNWSAGVFVRPSDDYDPAAVSAEIQRVRASGLPELAHASLRRRGGSAADAPVLMPRAEGAPRLTMSYMQAHTIDPVIPGLRHNESVLSTSTRPNGADSVSVQQLEAAGRSHISVAYFPHAVSGDALRTAVENFLTDPRGCLLERPTARLR